LYFKLTEFIQQPTKKSLHHNQDTKPSHILHNQTTTQPRINNNIKLGCTINGCCNNRSRLGTICSEHIKYKRYTGTYNPSNLNFRNDVSIPSRAIYKDGFSSDTLESLAEDITRLFKNPYSHHIEILKGSHKETLCNSKEKISRYIKEHHTTRELSPHHLAIRLGYVFKLYQDGLIEAGGQLRFNLAKALLPYTNSSGQGLSIKEVIGNIVLKNYITKLSIIAEEISTKHNL